MENPTGTVTGGGNIKSRLPGPAVIAAAVIAVSVALAGVYLLNRAGINNLQSLKVFLLDECPHCYRVSSYFYNTALSNGLGSPYFYLALGATLLAEHLIPAENKQPVFSAGFWQDLIWFFAYLFVIFALLDAYQRLLASGYHHYLDFLRVETVSHWPVGLQIVAVILVSDFMAWFHHLVRHKVPWFWQFHIIHHSQQQMNLFTDLRNHPIDTLIAYTVRFVPLVSLTSHAVFPTAAGWVFFNRWYTHFYHANLKTNFGPLRYVLVTPQSHRIHHSVREEHQDRNFGVLFSFWDRIFGTLYRDYDDYPPTGVADVDFRSGSGFATSLVRQLVFPFRQIAESLRRRAAP